MLRPTFHGPVLWLALFGFFSLNKATAKVSPSYLTTNDPYIQEYSRICPLPRCERCATIQQIEAPGVGFALEMGYGAVVIRLHDGTYQNVALIEGELSFTTLFRSLATGPQNRIPNQIPSRQDKLRYLKRRAQRLLNQALGYPATPETAILAELISTLKAATESRLGGGKVVTAAVLSSPDRIRLTAEEITDVFDYLGMRNLMAEPDTLGNLYATSAAYAGFGMGLCGSYTDPYACEREEHLFPTQRLLHLDFTPVSLSGTIKSLKSAKDGLVEETFIDLDLGLGRLDALNAISTSKPHDGIVYWSAIASRIRALVQSFKPQITQLMLTGSSAADQRFKAAVKDALREMVPDSALKILLGDDEAASKGEVDRDQVADLVFATARGAAEFAKRRQEGPVRCAESEECKQVRERERESRVREEETRAKPELKDVA